MKDISKRQEHVLFYEGAKVLFNIALAIFKMNEEELLMTHHVGNAIKIIQNTTRHLFDPDDLMTNQKEMEGTLSTEEPTRAGTIGQCRDFRSHRCRIERVGGGEQSVVRRASGRDADPIEHRVGVDFIVGVTKAHKITG
ncbi:hypothetical protein E3N88_14917 [Mikania micrantha]|uniref:Uncharacterized protein n=1 Tax=Mikania micrantha TaxID=192012 RepID=A0A5N6P442_9ASTR|nr:hypothetical protein E3N88_14917 [Mikania micrantha]